MKTTKSKLHHSCTRNQLLQFLILCSFSLYSMTSGPVVYVGLIHLHVCDRSHNLVLDSRDLEPSLLVELRTPDNWTVFVILLTSLMI